MDDKTLQELSKLTPEEIQKVKEILGELVEDGKSEELNDLYYEDYEEIPVDLNTFLCDEMYLGKYTNYGKDIYDTWKKELEYVYNPNTICEQWAITRLNAEQVRVRSLLIPYVMSYINLCA